MVSPMDNNDLISILAKGEEEEVKQDTKDSQVGSEDTEDDSNGVGTSLKTTMSAMDVLDIEDSSNHSTTGISSGSGDVSQDLENWIDGKDLAPSDDLNRFVSATDVKFKYGLTHNTLNNFTLMAQLQKFLDTSNEILFSESAAMNLSPEELESRVRMAFTMYAELSRINQRTALALEEQRRKYNDGSTDIDKLSLLLSSVPSDKLKEILYAITKSKG
jgi:hypothetical protein|nr:MAG TPA: hypothetical protein [Caudoviricetes sp.]